MKLPPEIKQALRPYFRAIPQWTCIALPREQTLIRVEFESVGYTTDVTHCHTVASLNPLTIAINNVEERQRGRLMFRERRSGTLLGWLDVKQELRVNDIGLYHIENGDHRCLKWPLRPWNRRLQAQAQLSFKDPNNFALPPDTLQHLMIAYIAPRPVVLVSVSTPEHQNIFPMDLIGPLGPGRFSLALRNTSHSVPVMQEATKVALADVPAVFRAETYSLGKHHRFEKIDWSSIPFPLATSRKFEIPTIANALRIREMEIEKFITIGSHQFFVGHIENEEHYSNKNQLHHTSGFHALWQQKNRNSVEIA